MKKTKTLYVVIVVLIVLNVFMIGLCFFQKPNFPPHHGNGLKNRIIAELHLSKEQISTYENLIFKHRQEVKKLEKEKSNLKQTLYMQLDDPQQTEARKKHLLDKIGQIHEAIEEVNYQHFQSLYALCTNEQLIYFKKFQKKISHLFEHRPPPHLRRRGLH